MIKELKVFFWKSSYTNELSSTIFMWSISSDKYNSKKLRKLSTFQIIDVLFPSLGKIRFKLKETWTRRSNYVLRQDDRCAEGLGVTSTPDWQFPNKIVWHRLMPIRSNFFCPTFFALKSSLGWKSRIGESIVSVFCSLARVNFNWLLGNAIHIFFAIEVIEDIWKGKMIVFRTSGFPAVNEWWLSIGVDVPWNKTISNSRWNDLFRSFQCGLHKFFIFWIERRFRGIVWPLINRNSFYIY